MDYDSASKQLGNFFKLYPNLPQFDGTNAGFQKFCEDWNNHVCKTKTLWDIAHSAYELNKQQRDSLIQDFRSQHGQCPLLIHSLVYNYMTEKSKSTESSIELRLISTELENLDQEKQVIEERAQEKETLFKTIFSEFFSKVNPRSKADLVQFIGETFNEPFPITMTQMASQESSSRCSITSSRSNIFHTNKDNSFALEHIGPHGNLVIGWDKADVSQDSCRAVIDEAYTIIALCDGVSSKPTSGIYSSALTESLVNDFVFTRKNALLFGSDFVSESIDSKLNASSIHPMFNRFFSTTINNQLSDLHDGQSTLIQIIIHPTGLVQYHRLGDSCLWVIEDGSSLRLLSAPDDIENSMTEYVGKRMRFNQNVASGFIKLKPNDALFACTDQIAEWLNDGGNDGGNEEFIKWFNELQSAQDLNATCSDFLDFVADQHGGDDHQTWALYVQKGNNLANTEVLEEIKYLANTRQVEWKGELYSQKGDREYYFNEKTGRGLKNLPSESIFSNLSSHSKNYEMPWLLDYTPVLGNNEGDLCYVLEMKHLSDDEGYVDVGEINWNDFDDENVRELLPRMEELLKSLRREMDSSCVTHRDIALDNMFYDKNRGKLILIDHNSIYSHGAFTGYSGDGLYEEEIGHPGCYGPHDRNYTSNIFHNSSHRFPLKMLEFSFKILNTIEGKEDYEELVIMDLSGSFVFSETEVISLFLPKADNSDLIERISEVSTLGIIELESIFESLAFPQAFLTT